MVDARDFDRTLLDLIDSDIGSEDQFASPRDASGAAALGKFS